MQQLETTMDPKGHYLYNTTNEILPGGVLLVLQRITR